MSNPRRTTAHGLIRRRNRRRALVLSLSFVVGLLLVALPLELMTSFAAAQSDLIAPIFLPPEPPVWSREKPAVPINDQVDVPDELSICIGYTGTLYDLFGKVQDQGKTYYLLGMAWNRLPYNPLNTFDELIEADAQTGCERLFPVETNADCQPLTAYMSETAAQSLELQRYRKLITDFGGVAQLQQALRDHLEPGASYLFSPEQIRAFQQLHIELPPYQPLQPQEPAAP